MKKSIVRDQWKLSKVIWCNPHKECDPPERTSTRLKKSSVKRKNCYLPSKQKNSISGITPSENSTLMTVGDYPLDPEVEMSTS